MIGLPDLTTSPRAIAVTKRPVPMTVEFAKRDGWVETLEGKVGYRAGDVLLTGVQNERWPVSRADFLAGYEPVPPTLEGMDGRYVKRPVVALALRLDAPVEVCVGWQADRLFGLAGDWLLRYPDGTHGILSNAIFRETYVTADPYHRPTHG